jgi:hypothetical protein
MMVKSKNTGLAGNRTLDHSQAYPGQDIMLSEYYTTKPQARQRDLMKLTSKLQYIYRKIKNHTSGAVNTHLKSKNCCLALHPSTRRPEQFCCKVLVLGLAHDIYSQEGARERTKSCYA